MSLSLWPYLPAGAMRETLDWDTQIISGRGDEQRIARRLRPRGALTLSHVFRRFGAGDAPDLAPALAILEAAGADDLLCPAWPEAQRVGDLTALDDAVDLDPDLGAWEVGGAVGLIPRGGSAITVTAEIAALREDGIDLAAPLGAALSSPQIVPLRPAALETSAQTSEGPGGLCAMTLRLEWRSAPTLSAPGGETWDGVDVLTDAGRGAPISGGLLREAEAIGAPPGARARVATRAAADITRTLTFIDQGAARWERRRWLHARRGRQRAFWLAMPGALQLAAAVDPLDESVSLVAPPDPEELVGHGLRLESDTDLAHLLLGEVVSVGGVATYALSAAVGDPFPTSAAAQAMRLHRLDADVIDLSHDAGIQRLSLPLIERPA